MNKPIINVFIYSLSNYLMCKLCTFIGSLVFLFIYSKGLFLCTGLMKRDQERENMRRDWKSNKPYNTQHQRKSPLALTLRGEWFFVQYLTIPLPVDRPAPYLIDCLKGKVYFVMLMQHMWHWAEADISENLCYVCKRQHVTWQHVLPLELRLDYMCVLVFEEPTVYVP